MSSHASHLGIDLREYDARIRTFVPAYEEMLDEAAAAVDTLVAKRAPRVLDLGIGTGALSARVLRVRPQARIVGIDSDPAMLAVAARRLGGRLDSIEADFSRADLRSVHDRREPPFDAITASLALHHVRTRRHKAAVYRRCFAALGPRGVLVSADNCLASSPAIQRADRAAWRGHLERSYTRSQSEHYLRTWAREDVYFRLDDERELMEAAGFAVDIVWRRRLFAVLVGLKKR